MADILDFRPPAGKSAKRAQPRGCEIVIFPGVRYERSEMAASTDETSTRSSRKRSVKRDTLELAD